MIFEIYALQGEIKQTFYYDNIENILSDKDGNIFEYPENSFTPESRQEFIQFSPNLPLKKSKKINILKIQLGLSCNYSCTYCSQRFVAKPEETNKGYIEQFMSMLDNIEFNEKEGLKIELWGGEPFVYWKTMKPLVTAIKERFSDWESSPRISIITNGSVLSDEINDWIIENISSIAISHDGPGQHVRGPDPFEVAEERRLILELHNAMQGKTSFNAMLNSKNMSRKEIYEWFVELTGNENVSVGEGSLVDAYDEGGLELSLLTKADHFKFRQIAFNDIYSTDGKIGFVNIINKLDGFIKDVLSHSKAKYLPQKCGMDQENTIAVDLTGNVITCQNVSAVSVNSNDEPHLSGNLSDIDAVRITTSTHWSKREHCSSCPVLHLCKGSCMFVTGDYWEKSCANAYSDAVSLFALAIERMTGFIPIYINNDVLPDERKDIWGTILTHEEVKVPYKFPIKVITENL